MNTTVPVKNKMSFFSLLCCLVYFTSYLTRIDYAAALVEIISDIGITKELGSIAVTGSFITYGAGQIISGVIGDHIHPRYMITAGLAATSLMNILMPAMPNIYFMTVFWCFNGFFQAMLWPPLVRMMAENLDERSYNKTCVLVSASASAATIFVYLLAPVAIMFSGWRLVFMIAGGAGVTVSVLWFAGTRGVAEADRNKAVSTEKEKSGSAVLKVSIVSSLIPVMAAIILQGILRDGISTWMPTYIKEVYSLGNSVSILTAVILPVFSIISVSVASIIQKKLKNELSTSTLLFAVASAAVLIMIPLFSSSMAASSFLMAVITGCMHGINLMLISRLPAYYRKYGRVSTISGVLNACTYIGSALSTYGFAYLSERFGWRFTVISWAAVACAGLLLCALNIRRWNKFSSR